MTRLAIDVELLRRLWLADVRVADIAAHVGCSRAYASVLALRMGLPRRLTPTAELPQREILRVYTEHGLSVRAIVEQLRPRFPRLSETTVQRIVRAAGVMRGRGAPPVDRVVECVRMVRAGMECPAIGRRLGLTDGQVEYRARKVLPGIGRGRKARVPVRAILSRAAAGEKHDAIARDYGISRSTVSYHVRKVRRSRRERVA